MVGRYRLIRPAQDGDDYFDRLVDVVRSALNDGAIPAGQYIAVLVDEAHDFQETWLAMLPRLVDKVTNSLLILYDDAQSIYQKKRKQFSFASVGIQAVGRTSILRFNYRNTSEILGLAARCAAGMLVAKRDEKSDVAVVNPFSSGRRGPVPEFIEAVNVREEYDLVIDRISGLIKQGVPLSDVAVLFRVKRMMADFSERLERRGIPFQSMGGKNFKSFDWGEQCVRLITLHSAKGLEFPYVYIVDINRMPLRNEPMEDEVRLLYVGMTRATHSLVLSAHGQSAVVDLVRSALDHGRARGSAELAVDGRIRAA
jgi:superfamily I DNA/RNA helicase